MNKQFKLLLVTNVGMLHPEFYIVEDIATKLVAKDLLQHSDYTQLIVSGSDKVPLDSKVRNLAEDTESKIDSLIGVAFY